MTRAQRDVYSNGLFLTIATIDPGHTKISELLPPEQLHFQHLFCAIQECVGALSDTEQFTVKEHFHFEHNVRRSGRGENRNATLKENMELG